MPLENRSGPIDAHALVVGIAQYAFANSLPAQVKEDARGICDALIDALRCAYPPAQVTLLLDEQASQAALRQALADLGERAGEDSTVFIYLSCHGASLSGGPYAGEYLLPVDANDASAQLLSETSISDAEFTFRLQSIRARKLVVVFDCCHAGGIGRPKGLAAQPVAEALPESYYEALARGRGRAILASSRSNELSWILEGASHSLFTSHLLDGLRGGALGSGGVIRIFDLFDYVQPRVTAARPDQHPIFKAEIEENFPVALYLGGQKSAPAAPAVPPDQYEYDAFISYSGESVDRQWLRQRLIPPLEAASLRIAVDFRAPLGLPRLLFSESAIKNSRYTLLILSERYLASGYAEFENLAAQQLGIEQSRYRLLPLIAEPCTPRLGLRTLPILDLSDPDEQSYNLDRLIDQLRMPPRQRAAGSQPA